MTEKERQEALDKLTEGFRKKHEAEKTMDTGYKLASIGLFGVFLSLAIALLELWFYLMILIMS